MKNKHCDTYDSRRGFAALLTVVIMAAAVLTIAVGSSLVGLGELDMAYVSQKGEEAFALTDGCVEETLHQLRLDEDYSVGATTTVTLSNGSCAIFVAASGSDRTITVLGTVVNFNKKLEVQVTVSSGVVTVTSWEELES